MKKVLFSKFNIKITSIFVHFYVHIGLQVRHSPVLAMKLSMEYGTQLLEMIALHHQPVRVLATTIHWKCQYTHVIIISATSIQILARVLLVVMRCHAV
jgi:hypothetical protein